MIAEGDNSQKTIRIPAHLYGRLQEIMAKRNRERGRRKELTLASLVRMILAESVKKSLDKR
jgi:hypothetical protein